MRRASEPSLAQAYHLRVYRVCKAKYAPFDGSGAAIHGGRWNSPGRAVVCGASSYGGALLEILAHAAQDTLPGRHHVVTIDIPATVAIREVYPDDVPGWAAPDAEASRAYGDAWLRTGDTAILIVPSVVASPYERNVVINVLHPDTSKLIVSAPEMVRWDPRLLPSASIAGP